MSQAFEPGELAMVRRMMQRYADRYVMALGIDDFDNEHVLIISRVGAVALGLDSDGCFPEDADEDEIDELFADAIQPNLN